MTPRPTILAVLISINLFIWCTSLNGKCANAYITIKGVIVGPQSESHKITVQVVPSANSGLEPGFEIKEGNFEGSVLFDTTKSGGAKHHNCSRTPKKVRVALLNETSEIDSIWLSVAKDFTKDKMGDYAVRSPVELHSK